jgi:tRNA threonylcarbamoyladenosine biosynthesis protein TsaE
LLEPYEIGDVSCYHFDLYRLSDIEELEYLGIKDLLESNAYMLIEWPERGEGGLPAPDLVVEIAHKEMARSIKIRGISKKGEEIVQELPSDLING